jgi:ankyrin repeat protein
MRKFLTLLVMGFAATVASAGDMLFDAVSAGDKTAVEQALTGGSNVDQRARDGATPLINAALGNQLAISELLIAKGADVMARNSGGFTPLHAAAFSGSLPIAKLLLEKGAVLEDAANKSGVTPMMIAVEENHVGLAEFLITKGADVNRGEAHGYKPITRAFWKDNKEAMKLLRRYGATCQDATILGSDAEVARCLQIQ